MLDAEREYSTIFSNVEKSELDQYLDTRNAATAWMNDILKRPTGRESDLCLISSRREKLKINLAIASTTVRKAVCLSIAQNWNGWMYEELSMKTSRDQLMQKAPIIINDLSLLNDSFALLNELKPTTTGSITTVSLNKIQTKNTSTGLNKPEVLGLFGLNGSGKTTAKNGLIEFCKFVGINASDTKFPRRDTPISPAILSSLAGEGNIEGVALQTLFIADYLDWIRRLDNDSPLQLTDRLAPVDGLIYPEDKLGRLMSAVAFEAQTIPISAVIIDSHPTACFERVKKRGTPLRKFEQSPEMMSLQQSRMAALSHLPFVRFVNTDFPGEVTPEKLNYVQIRIIDTAISTGVLGRQMVRQGLHDNFASAQNDLHGKSWEWYYLQTRRNNI